MPATTSPTTPPRRRPWAALLVGLAALTAAATTAAVPVAAAAPTTAPAKQEPTPTPARTGTFDGTLPDGATWLVDVPTTWNGTLLLYGHGLVPPGSPNPAEVAPDPITRAQLLADGYALAGSSYASTGMAVDEALADQLAVLAVFEAQVGAPNRTMAWGSSLGGLVTTLLLERHPEQFVGGLSLCGPLAGGVGLWNTYLDGLFVLSTLLATPVDLVGITDPAAAFADVATLGAALDAAQATPEGRARIALAAAVLDLPGWIGAGTPRPADGDVDAQEAAQYEHFKTTILFGLVLRADQEARVGGNPSTNVGVDYGHQLRRSSSEREVRRLYERAGRSLGADLDRLAAAPRIAADPAAVARLTASTSPTGRLQDPFVTLHTSGDQLATVEHEHALATTVQRAGAARDLRQLYTERAGHCTFTPAEIITALDVLTDRLDNGRFDQHLDHRTLDRRARVLGPDLNVAFDDETQSLIPVDPSFSDRRPGRFLRPGASAGG